MSCVYSEQAPYCSTMQWVLDHVSYTCVDVQFKVKRLVCTVSGHSTAVQRWVLHHVSYTCVDVQFKVKRLAVCAASRHQPAGWPSVQGHVWGQGLPGGHTVGGVPATEPGAGPSAGQQGQGPAEHHGQVWGCPRGQCVCERWDGECVRERLRKCVCVCDLEEGVCEREIEEECVCLHVCMIERGGGCLNERETERVYVCLREKERGGGGER